MNVKTAFRKAVEAYPERERRVALATFVIRYSRGWHLSDYRCVGLDADVIRLFLKECGFGTDAVKDEVTQRDPDSHLLQWPDRHTIGRLAAELQETLSTEARRRELYAAQLDRTPDPAPNLRDDAPVGEDAPVWDPLGLYPATLALATRLHEIRAGADPESVQWAEAWLARGKAARTVTAPMWVLERAMPGNLGLLSATWRSSSGQTSAIPFSFGRYVRRDEPLSPPFPVIASMPVANVWGVSSRHGQTPLDGYVAVTFGDLMDVEPDAPGTSAAKRRDMWMHIESAYVTVDGVGGMKQVELLTRPKLLWRYVCSMFEATYGRRTVLVPDQCLVHSGQAARAALETVSALDTAVANGQRLEIRAALMISDEEPAASSKPCGADRVAAGAPNLIVLPGDPRPGTDPYVRDDGRFDLTGTLALEWYLMTHMLSGAPLRPPAARSQGGDPHVTEAIRRWAAETERVPGEAQLPDETAVRYDFRYGYNAGTHIACSILDNMRNSMDLKEFNAIGPADWQGANKELHGVRKPVVAVYSCVLGDGCPVPDLTKGATPAAVTKALDAIADPAVQLAAPADPKAVMVVVETQIKYPKGRLPSMVGRHTLDQYLRDLFLWGLMVNQCKHPSYTLCHRNSDEPAQRFIRDELRQLGIPQYHFLWAKGPRGRTMIAGMNDDGDYDALAEHVQDSTEVKMLKDSHGRLVLAFKVVALSPVECACRAAFRYYANAPVLGNEAMARVFAAQAEKYIVLDPGAPDLARVVRAHIEGGSCGVVPGWTSVAGQWWDANLRSSAPPSADAYEYAGRIADLTGSSIVKALS